MPETKCGFDNVPGGASGQELLTTWGPTLFVDIGFDPNYNPSGAPLQVPVSGITGVRALVDAGASESCIDAILAAQLNLPIIDKRLISGVGGSHSVNIYMAQVHVPSLAFTLYGPFAGVDLTAGCQIHRALIGRTFLQNFTMIYEGLTGTVKLSRP